MSRKPSKSTIAKKAWKTRRENAKTLKDIKGNNISLEDMDKAMGYALTAKPEMKPALSFADCIFQIVNSTMDQSAKVMAFDAMKVAAQNMRF